jgi:hypothetical protein
MKSARLFFVLLLLPVILVLPNTTLWGQTAGQNPVAATITFDRVWEEYTPQKTTMTVSATGQVKYVSHTAAKPPDEADDYQTEFTVSAASRDKRFHYASEANYFEGDFTFKKHAVASTGSKTLTYTDPTRHFKTTYDYSENKAIQEITSLFQGISNTVESGRKLQFKHRFDKLGLEDELKAMEAAFESHDLEELQLIAPILQSITDDISVLNIARQRAKKLLHNAHSE